MNFLERKTESLHKGDHHYTGVLFLFVPFSCRALALLDLCLITNLLPFPHLEAATAGKSLKQRGHPPAGGWWPQGSTCGGLCCQQVCLQVFFLTGYCCPTLLMSTTFSQTSFQTVLRLWSGSSGPSRSHCTRPELCLSSAADARDATPLPVDCQHNYKVPEMFMLHQIWPSGKLRCGLILFLFCRTYRGFNLSNTVADVTLENNLSRVITAVSRALTSSTSRAVTVSSDFAYMSTSWVKKKDSVLPFV